MFLLPPELVELAWCVGVGADGGAATAHGVTPFQLWLVPLPVLPSWQLTEKEVPQAR